MQTGENKQQHMVEGRLLRIYGIVQGVGFRPFVKRTADACEIYGSVCNRGPYVEIRAFGIPADLDRFAGSIQNNPPERAVILKLDSMPLSAEDTPASFSIIQAVFTPLHQLHLLRPQGHDSRWDALRQGADQHEGVSDVPEVPV